jgi:type I restriction enzyme S subunit
VKSVQSKKSVIQTNNWQTKKLGEVCDFEGGSQPPKINFIHEPRKGYVRFLQIRDFTSDKHITYIPDSKKNRHCAEDDILLGRYGASVGKILINKKGAYNVAVMKTLPKCDLLDKKYFYFYLISDEFQKRLSKVAARSAQAGFGKDDIYDFPVIIPPLSKQHRIVKILDEVFKKTAKAKENAEKNLQNYKELLESYLQNVFANSNKDWEEKSLEEIANVEYGYTNKAKSNGDYRYVRITDTTKDGLLTEENKLYIKSFREKDRFILGQGDLLMARVGASFGNVLFFESDEPAVFASYLIRIKFGKKLASKLYWYFSRSKIYWDQVKKLSSGSAQPQFNGGALKKIIFTYPKSISEQKSIVAKLDALSAETKKLEAIYKKKLADLEELKKSVLKKAFAGEL